MKTNFVFVSILFMLVTSFVPEAQYIIVSGFVSNLNTGDFLENASVFESVSTIGTLTDKHGYYKLMLKKGEAKILVSHGGYKDIAKNIVLENDTTINIRLTPVFVKNKPKADAQVQHVKTSEQAPRKTKASK